MDLIELWKGFKEFFIDFVKYGFLSIAIIVSILSYIQSRKANKVKERLNNLEEKLKRYELAEKEKQIAEANMACVEARVVKIAKHQYRLKVWNSGQATAYFVDFELDDENKSFVRKEMVPYEFLNSGKSFEEYVLFHSRTPNKFKVITTWKDQQGNPYTKENMVSL